MGDIVVNEDTYKLESALCMPSAVHGYSLAVEYMRDWFINKFDKNYFKTVFINGKHVLDDYRRFSIGELVKKDKPAVAITPAINFEYDRNTQDLYMGGTDLLLGKFNHEKGFFKDWEKNIFLGLNLRELEVGFNFRVRVSTRAQQIDLYRHMELAFRVNFTQFQYITADFHIPMELMLNMASHAGFEVINDKITDIAEFVNYANEHSEFPITYSLRTINGKNEFFIRVPNVYVHIACLDKLSADDGEREGAGDNNFHVEMVAVLRMMVPHYYVYKSVQRISKYIPTSESSDFGMYLYSFKVFDIPEYNEKKWNRYLTTDYTFSEDELYTVNVPIDLNNLFNDEAKTIISNHIKMGISPSSFIDVVLYNFSEDSDCTIDWENMQLIIPEAISGRIHIAVYIDMKYYNVQQLKIKSE
jgi:hypothetical protein